MIKVIFAELDLSGMDLNDKQLIEEKALLRARQLGGSLKRYWVSVRAQIPICGLEVEKAFS